MPNGKPNARRKKAAAKPQEPQPDGLLVLVADDGNLSVQTLGQTKPTEALTLLEIAAKNVRDKIHSG